MITNCKEISRLIKENVKDNIDYIINNVEHCRKPCLAVIICGEDPASKVYVKNKHKVCDEVGIKSVNIEFPENVTQEKLISKINELNDDSKIDGILVQLPLPKHINKDLIINAIDPLKDVDGFTISNIGSLYSGNPFLVPCTPLGVMKIFEYYNYNLEGKKVTIVGRSNNVGFPLFKLILDKNATPTLCHSKTKNLKEHLLNSDVIISAVGKPKLITEDMVKDGAFIVDIAINRIKDDNSKNGSKLVGDVDFENVKDKCSYITPVPGGVGIMTVTMLMYNTYQSFRNHICDTYVLPKYEYDSEDENELIMTYNGNSLYKLSSSNLCDGVPHNIIKEMFPLFKETTETFTNSYFIVDKDKNVIYE